MILVSISIDTDNKQNNQKLTGKENRRIIENRFISSTPAFRELDGARAGTLHCHHSATRP